MCTFSTFVSECRYKNIHKPSWQPPAFLFGPVWSVLYILMGVGAWQVWKHGGWAAQKDALSLWVFQFIFNLFWNPLFFLKHDMSLALFDIGGMHPNPIPSQISCRLSIRSLCFPNCCRNNMLIPSSFGRQDQDLCHTLYIENDSSSLPAVLWALVIVLIGVFVKVEPLAGYLQLPYLAWVTFASVLNYTLLKLNTQPVSSPFICCVHDLMTSATCLLANMACSPHISSL